MKDLEDEEFKNLNVERKGDEVEKNRKKIYPHSDRVEELRKLLADADFLKNSNLGNTIDPTAEQQDADDNENQNEPADVLDDFPDDAFSSKEQRKSQSSNQEKIVYKLPILDDNDTMKANVWNLWGRLDSVASNQTKIWQIYHQAKASAPFRSLIVVQGRTQSIQIVSR